MKLAALILGVIMNLNLCFANIKAVIFDCDGTLVDSEIAHFQSWRAALQKFGSDLTLEEYYPYVGQQVAKAFAARIREGDISPDRLLEEKRFFYEGLIRSGMPAIEPTVELLRSLLQEKDNLGLKVGVCSASKKKFILSHLKHLGVDHLLDIVLSGQDDLTEYGDNEKVNKPKPYIYLHAMKLLNVLPSECIVIEDSSSGVRAGVDAGCFTIAVPNEFTRTQDFSHAHLRVESFENIDLEQFFKMAENAN